jgi:hypothetical protein
MPLYSPFGDRQSAAIHDTGESSAFGNSPGYLVAGTVSGITSVDLQDSQGRLQNIPGTYLTYTVKLAPRGVFIHDVPAMMSGGHTRCKTTTLASNELGHQNTEETPYVIGQPVLVGFVNGSNFNPVILGPLACQLNAATVSPDGSENFPLDPQTCGTKISLDPATGASSGDHVYPQKQGIFQGTSWKIDKNGNPTVNIKASGRLNVQINGVPFVTIDGASNTVDLGATADHVNLGEAIESTVLGTTLKDYLADFITNTFNKHTHASCTTAAGVSPAAIPSPPTPTGTEPTDAILTSVVKVS